MVGVRIRLKGEGDMTVKRKGSAQEFELVEARSLQLPDVPKHARSIQAANQMLKHSFYGRQQCLQVMLAKVTLPRFGSPASHLRMSRTTLILQPVSIIDMVVWPFVLQQSAIE